MLRRFASEERGVVAPMAALLLIVLVGFCALVLDFGTIYANRRALQNAADAAALAGAKEIQQQLAGGNSGVGNAATLASSFAAKNGVPAANTGAKCTSDGSATVVTNTSGPMANSWQVDTSRLVKLTFGPVIGVSQMCVSAHAVAVVTDVSVAKVWPWGILSNQESQFVTPGTGNECNPGNMSTSNKYCFELKEGAGAGQQGNYGILDFPVSGSCAAPNTPNYDYWATNGYGNRAGEVVPGPIPTNTWTICTTPGNKVSGDKTVQDFITANQQNPPPGCGATDPPNLKCPLIGLVPILRESQWPNGHSGTMTVIDFAIFKLVAVTNAFSGKNGNGHLEVIGEFLKYADAVGPTQPPNPDGTVHSAIGIRLWQ